MVFDLRADPTIPRASGERKREAKGALVENRAIGHAVGAARRNFAKTIDGMEIIGGQWQSANPRPAVGTLLPAGPAEL